MMRLISCAISAWKAKVSASSSSIAASCCTSGSAIAEQNARSRVESEREKKKVVQHRAAAILYREARIAESSGKSYTWFIGAACALAAGAEC